MSAFVPFSDVLSDSPRFRSRLGAAEANLEDLESRLERVLKASSSVGEAGRAFVGQQTQFLASLWELSSHFAAASSSAPSSDTVTHLNGLIHAYQEVVKLQNQAVEQAGRAVAKGLTKFLRCFHMEMLLPVPTDCDQCSAMFLPNLLYIVSTELTFSPYSPSIGKTSSR